MAVGQGRAYSGTERLSHAPAVTRPPPFRFPPRPMRRCDVRYSRRFVKLWKAWTPSNSARHSLSSRSRSPSSSLPAHGAPLDYQRARRAQGPGAVQCMHHTWQYKKEALQVAHCAQPQGVLSHLTQIVAAPSGTAKVPL